MSRQALGRGLSALLGEDPIIKSSDEGLIEIDIDLISPNIDQPRTRFTEVSLEELAQSIKVNGIVQPILVRKNGNRYELIAGERRWRASQRAGLVKIPAIVKEVADDKILELALVENIQRQELNALEEAKAYRKLIDTVGLTQEMVAHRVGKDRTFITNYLRLLKLPDDIQSLVSEEKLSVGHARALLMIDDVSLQRKVARDILDSSLSVRETEKLAKRTAKGHLESTPKKVANTKNEANYKAAETKLRRKFATQVHIKSDGNGTGGTIIFEYYAEDDLDRIYQLMIGE